MGKSLAMTKAKIIYYKNGEIVDTWRGNYSCSSLYKSLGARRIFEQHSKWLLYDTCDLEYDCIELYKRNRAGVKRRLVGRVERH